MTSSCADGSSVRIGLVGYGTIGKRLVTAIDRSSEFRLSGVAARRPTPGLADIAQTMPIHATESSVDTWRDADFTPAGDLAALARSSDVVLDCTPRGTGVAHQDIYRDAGCKVIYQGGEPGDLADVDYCYGLNFHQARTAQSVRIPSCNTTALVRVLTAIGGVSVLRSVRAVLIRSATDPDKAYKGTVNNLIPSPGLSHHGKDLKAFWPTLDVQTLAVSAPVNCGHLMEIFATLATSVTRQEILDGLTRAARVQVLDDGPGSLSDLRQKLGAGPRRDAPSALVWNAGVSVGEQEVSLALGVHMESIVIPETLDALQAMAGLSDDAGTAMLRSDEICGIDGDTQCAPAPREVVHDPH